MSLKTALLFTATREGTLHIFHEDTPDKFSLVETSKQNWARNMALDSKTHNFSLTLRFCSCSRAYYGAAQPQPILFGTFRLLVYGRLSWQPLRFSGSRM